MTTGTEGLTVEEHKVLDGLRDAWQAFTKLPFNHPDENDEFRHAIHLAQQLIAMRVARRVEPRFVTYKDE